MNPETLMMTSATILALCVVVLLINFSNFKEITPARMFIHGLFGFIATGAIFALIGGFLWFLVIVGKS